jgi:hypothetical protein
LACSGKQDQNLETMGGESQPRRTQHEKPDATAARKTRTAAAGPRLRHEPSEEFQICRRERKTQLQAAPWSMTRPDLIGARAQRPKKETKTCEDKIDTGGA